jgi:hypothetical protein
VIFGDQLTVARDTAPTDWIAPTCRGAAGTVGAFVPNVYPSIVRVDAPPSIPGDWWSTYRRLFGIVAGVGARYTSRPDRAWFAVWEGHGFDTASTHVAWRDAAVDDDRRARDAERVRLREEDRRRNAAIRLGLSAVPRFALPSRTCYLMGGPVSAVVGLCDPSSLHWRNPDLFWPDDRRWFVATDVDFWSLYVGGDDLFTARLAQAVAHPTEVVSSSHPLEIED